jgi:hypothetical protein
MGITTTTNNRFINRPPFFILLRLCPGSIHPLSECIFFLPWQYGKLKGISWCEKFSGRVRLNDRIGHAGIFLLDGHLILGQPICNRLLILHRFIEIKYFCSVEKNHGLILLEEPGSDSAIKIGSRLIRIGF